MRRALAAALCFSVFVAACGGGGDDERNAGATGSTESAAETAAPSKEREAYIAKADALCRKAGTSKEGKAVTRSLEKLARTPQDKPSFPRVAAAHFRNVLKLVAVVRQDLEALEPPPEDAVRIEEFNRANAEAVEHLEAVVDAFEEGKDADPAVEDYAGSLAQASQVAKDYGFKVCGRN